MEEGLGNSKGELVVKYSQKFQEVLRDRIQKGFKLAEAKVNFIVYWRDEDKKKEFKTVLPQIILTESVGHGLLSKYSSSTLLQLQVLGLSHTNNWYFQYQSLIHAEHPACCIPAHWPR